MTDSTQQLKAVSKRIGSSVIEKARPYFEALEAAKKAQKECQAAATAYQRAFGVHAAAKVHKNLVCVCSCKKCSKTHKGCSFRALGKTFYYFEDGLRNPGDN